MAPYTRITRYGIREANKGLKALNSAESGETTTETVTEAVAKEAVFYVGNKTEDELYYYVNPEGTDYTVAVSTAIIDSLSAADEMESVE